MGLYWLKSGNKLVEVNPVTGWLNVTKIRRKDGKTIAKSCPSKEEGKNIAEQYLKKRGLLPKDAYLWRVIRKPGKEVVRVGYLRKIGPYKTSGAGAQILVTVGPGGEVIDLRKNWQDLVPYKTYPIKSPQDALAELQQGKAVLSKGGSGKVEEITLRYYTSPQKQKYVQPIYYFECSGENGTFKGEVPAIKAEYLRPREDDHAAMGWMMCRECGAKYKMKLKQWQAVAESYVKEHPDSRTPPPLVCQQCGQKTAYRAIECGKCGSIFKAGWKGPDYYDRCPQCKFSQVEETMKKR
jgi:ribosomal protein L40E